MPLRERSLLSKLHEECLLETIDSFLFLMLRSSVVPSKSVDFHSSGKVLLQTLQTMWTHVEAVVNNVSYIIRRQLRALT